jgi:hypothetical protein
MKVIVKGEIDVEELAKKLIELADELIAKEAKENKSEES